MSYNDAPDGRGRFYYPSEVEAQGDGTFRAKDDGRRVYTKIMKMSKSRYNVTNPDDMCEQYGADAMRLYELFMGPLEDGAMWEDAGVAGTRRFLDRLWRVVVDTETGGLSSKIVDGSVADKDLDRALHAAIKKVTEAVESLKFNTAIADMMVFVNAATSATAVGRDQISAFIRVVAPFAPHVAEELWTRLGNAEGITYAPWPAFDDAKLAVDTITVAVQVNGKLRGTLSVPPDISEQDAIARAKADENIAKHLDGKTLRREIYVPGRLVNFVVA